MPIAPHRLIATEKVPDKNLPKVSLFHRVWTHARSSIPFLYYEALAFHLTPWRRHRIKALLQWPPRHSVSEIYGTHAAATLSTCARSSSVLRSVPETSSPCWDVMI